MRAAPAARAASAVRCFCNSKIADGVIHHHGPRTQSLRDGLPLLRILSPYACGQCKRRIIGALNSFLGIFHGLHRQDGAEGLFPKQIHRGIDAGDHRWLKEIRSQIRPCVAAAQNFRPARDSIFYQIEHALHMLWPNQRPDVRRWVAAGPHAQLPRLFHAQSSEFLCNPLFNKQPLHRQANLPAIRVTPPHRGARRHLQIRVGQNDHRVLSTQLKNRRN